MRTLKSRLGDRLRFIRDDERGFGLVEALIAVTMLVIGLIAVSGLSLTTAAQAQIADLRSDQMTAGQTAIEQLRRGGFDAASSGVDTLTSGGREFYVTRTVTEVNSLTKSVDVVIAPASGGLTSRSFSTVLHSARSIPSN
jgi:Tfp pilus assembly protein PilV